MDRTITDRDFWVHISGGYRVQFDKIRTPTFTEGAAEALRNFDVTLRQVLSDHSIKDIMEEEDRKIMETIARVV